MFPLMLRAYLVPRDVVERCIREVRSDSYEALRDVDRAAELDSGVRRFLAGLALDTLRVLPGSPLVGKTVGESMLRTRTGATVVALRCGEGCVVPNPDVGDTFEEGAVAVVQGTPEQLAAAALFGPPAEEAPAGEIGS